MRGVLIKPNIRFRHGLWEVRLRGIKPRNFVVARGRNIRQLTKVWNYLIPRMGEVEPRRPRRKRAS